MNIQIRPCTEEHGLVTWADKTDATFYSVYALVNECWEIVSDFPTQQEARDFAHSLWRESGHTIEDLT